MPELSFLNVSLSYQRRRAFGRTEQTDVLSGLSLTLRDGEFVSVIGRSGSGKTSLLNLAAGFVAPTAGRILLDARPVTGPGADRAVVFQDDALYPWLSARDNVALPLRLRGIAQPERDRRADELLDLVGLADRAGHAIWELSGGQRQRVGIVRALAAEPRFLLMDEPLGALDAMTRDRMHELLLNVWKTSGTGVLLITHSVEEALFLSTRVIVLADGRVADDRRTGFAERYLGGESARAIKSDADFIRAREDLIDAIHVEEGQLA